MYHSSEATIHVLDPIRDFAESITIMSSAAASSSSTAADGAAAATAKRKTTTNDDDSALPPDQAKNASLQRLVKQLNATIKAKKDQYTIVQLNDSPLRLIPGREDKILDEYEVECLSDLSSDQLNGIYNKLTQEEVDNYLHLMVVRESTVNLFEKQIKSIQFADTRFNNPDEDGDMMFMMFNTHSSYLMLQVMRKLFLVALKEVNKCNKTTSPAPGFAEKAFAHCFAATFAADHVEHWRHDTEDPESVFQYAKKIEKLWRDLLCFTDAELGLVDPGTRKALLQKLDSIGKSWKDDAMDWAPKSFKGINVKTAKNGQGMGRADSATAAASSESTASPPPSKKAKKAAATVSPDASSSPKISKLLTALDDAKLKMRAKTTLQIKITSDDEPTKSVLTVLSGATHIKKLNQICAYLTRNDGTFHYHSQKGKCLKGSKIELSYKGEKMWLCDKPTGKKASAAGASFVEDKGIKIVQIFQGLTVNTDDGIFFDNSEAKDFALTEGAVVWVAPNGNKYSVSVHCICATKSVMSGELLPRVVSIDGCGKIRNWAEYDMDAKTSFGMDIARTNAYMKGDREGRPMMFLGAPSEDEIEARSAINSARPISADNGGSICCVGEDRSERLFHLLPMLKKDLESAGLPDNGGVRAADGTSFVFEGEGMYGCKAVIKKK